jgi:dihydropteroate synthase-like protein
MPQHILFLTGSLAEQSLAQVLEEMGPTEFRWEVRNLGLKVAGLMTADMIRRRLTDTGDADLVLLPGRCRGDLEALSRHFGVPFVTGPEELRDIPEYFGRRGGPPDLSRHDLTIFAEIVDAPHLPLDVITARAAAHVADGADVIDLGCLPDVPFPHLGRAVTRLKSQGYRVSVDSLLPEDLLRGARSGADYLLSLTTETLWVADEVAATPVLIPTAHGDLDDLQRAYEALAGRGRPCIIDPVLDPIHFGFTDSLVRYREARRRMPEAPMMMGTGNLTELTEADTAGINTLLLGVASELGIGQVLTTQVSPHCRSVIRELDLARRVLYRARADASLPKMLHGGLTAVHERKPFPYTADEIRAAALRVRDPSFRIQASEEGIHIYNRDGVHSARDPFALFPHLAVEDDGGHAFYLGVELARAEIAHRLGKRYTQDQPLGWGTAAPAVEDAGSDGQEYAPPGATKARRAVEGS